MRLSVVTEIESAHYSEGREIEKRVKLDVSFIKKKWETDTQRERGRMKQFNSFE